jgi:hypothetical protein
MKFTYPAGFTLVFALVLALGLGCKRNSAPPTPLTAEELPGVLENTFSKAGPQAKELASQVVASVKAQDYSKAFWTIQNLAGVPGLSDEQVNVTARASLTINDLLQTAQAQGDAKATQTLQQHRINK